MLVKIKRKELYCDVYGISILLERKNKNISLIVYLEKSIQFIDIENVEILDNKFINGFIGLEDIENFFRLSFNEYKELCNYKNYYNLVTGYSEKEEVRAKEIFFTNNKNLQNKFLETRVAYAVLKKLLKSDLLETNNSIETYYFSNGEVEVIYEKNINTNKILKVEILKNERKNENKLI